MNRLYCMDCMQGMKEFPDKFFDLAIVDPPYGIGIDGQKKSINKNPKHNRKEHAKKGWDTMPPDEAYFRELERVSKKQVIWGGNYFVPMLSQAHKGWLVWDKGQRGLTMSDCELAYTSFDTPTRVFTLNRVELQVEGTIHPTQKPIRLYEWVLSLFAKQGYKILDTHTGSASSLIACYRYGLDYVGFEIEEDYFAAAQRRLETEKSQIRLFDYAQAAAGAEQSTLFDILGG
ncbi:Adenine-specific methyltransferase [Dehalobacter sp. UNSWDHB]|uniref:DNA-methyltransferase n=1 Tax=Dehalobacter sp. UNSWDHB TaxID=1339256 RepID=UPI000387607F|nr:DNA methyltransferase [Dehalobacter sp. UNSWDHB]EQB20067.1 Adenine-specific methyltransferase [Dehalobacter sp. UNSWDHB]